MSFSYLNISYNEGANNVFEPIIGQLLLYLHARPYVVVA